MPATIGLFVRASLMQGNIGELAEPPHVYVEISVDDALARFARSKGEGVVALIKAEIERRILAEATQNGVDMKIGFEGL